jgi:hypothetical protein
LLPEAQAVIASGIYETSFLETFLSNGQAREAPAPHWRWARRTAAWAAGDAVRVTSRPARPRAPRRAPRLAGLRNLARLDDLARCALSEQKEDADWRIAGERLAAQVPAFTDLSSALLSAPLPHRPHARRSATVERAGAEPLWRDGALPGGGDNVKALDRIRRSHLRSRLSGAGRLRERTVLQS